MQMIIFLPFKKSAPLQSRACNKEYHETDKTKYFKIKMTLVCLFCIFYIPATNLLVKMGLLHIPLYSNKKTKQTNKKTKTKQKQKTKTKTKNKTKQKITTGVFFLFLNFCFIVFF